MDHPMRALAKSSVSEHVPPSHMEILQTTSVGAVSWSPLLRHRVDLSIEPTPFETKGASVGGMDGSADINYLSEVNRQRDRHLDNLVTWERMPTSTSIGCATIIHGRGGRGRDAVFEGKASRLGRHQFWDFLSLPVSFESCLPSSCSRRELARRRITSSLHCRIIRFLLVVNILVVKWETLVCGRWRTHVPGNNLARNNHFVKTIFPFFDSAAAFRLPSL